MSQSKNGKDSKNLSMKFKKRKLSVDYNGGDLSANNIKLSPTLYSVPAGKIRIPEYLSEVPPDNLFIDLYRDFYLGKSNTYFTRISDSEILCGYFVKDIEAVVSENTPEKYIEECCRKIRGGHRPTVFLRENDGYPDAPKFFCSDSILLLKAYRRLGIKMIPAALVGRSISPFLPHSLFESNIAHSKGENGPRLVRVHPCSTRDLAAHSTNDKSFSQTLTVLRESVDETISRLVCFHEASDDPVHWHESNYSILVRIRDYLSSSILLIEKNFFDQAASLFRGVYELHLNFYIQWISPENEDLHLAYQLLSEPHLQKHVERSFLDSCRKERSEQDAIERTKRAFFFVRWLGVVKNKADFSPVGMGLHTKFYPFLSSAIHQDFSQTASHANRFEDNSYQTELQKNFSKLILFVNILVTETLALVTDDLGSS
jgi:hypothetical protein